jgi:hypothetical protein
VVAALGLVAQNVPFHHTGEMLARRYRISVRTVPIRAMNSPDPRAHDDGGFADRST